MRILRLEVVLFILLDVFLCENVLCRDYSICQNGGTCILNSVLPAISQCASDEVFYDDGCLSLHPNVLDFETSSNLCSSKGGNLLNTKEDADIQFYTDFINGVMIGKEKVKGTRGVWINVRSVSHDGIPEWAETPQMYRVENFYWANGEPNIYANYSEVCVSLDLNNQRKMWITQNCSDLNYVVCKKPVATLNADFSSQCLCQEGFEGQYCETESSSNQKSQNVKCASDQFEFACTSGGQIMVDFASYGATEGAPCSGNFQPQTCYNKHSLTTLINRCQGLSYCNITDLPAAFPETPCFVKEELNLQYRLRCSNDTQADCASGSSYYQGRCYSISYETKKEKLSTFDEALAECNKKGGSLATSIDQAAHVELTKQLRGKVKNDQSQFWIGAKTDCQNNGKWLTGDSLSYIPPNSSLGSCDSCIAYYITANEAYYTALSCDERANYVCGAAPTTQRRTTQKYEPDTVERSTVAPTMLASEFDAFPNIWCPETEWRGITFPRTRGCVEAKIPCPDPENIVGTVFWKCDCATGKWKGQPNSNNCTHKWVHEVQQAVLRGDPAQDITKNITVQLKKTIAAQLYGGDITGTVEATMDLIDLARLQLSGLEDRTERQTRSTDFTKSMGSAGDQLLSTPTKSVWSELEPMNKISYASRLMNVLQTSGILWAEYMGSSTNTLMYEQWALDVQVMKPAPRATAFAGGGAMDDEIGPGIMAAPPMGDFESSGFGDESINISFSGFAKSPKIDMPSLSNIKKSVEPISGQRAMLNEGFGIQSASASLDRNPLKMAYSIFTTLGDLLMTNENEIINSQIVGASVNDAQRSLSLQENVTFCFPHIHLTGVKNPRCVYWDLEENKWSREGCSMTRTSKNETICTCNHLTSFAILMDVSGNVGKLSGGFSKALDIVSSIGCAFSVVCLALSLFVFTFFRSLYNVRNTIHRNLCLCLLISELVFVIGIDRTGTETACSVIALLIHYFLVCAFCWMLLEGYQLYMMLIQVFEPGTKRVLLYCVFAYGAPAVVVSISAGTSWKDYGTANYCWIDTSTKTIWAFIAPVIVVVAANIMFLLIALKAVLSVNGRDRSRTQRVVGWLKGSATLLCLLGVTWIFGFLTAVKGSATMVFAWLFTILNCTQGIFIFVLHVVCNDKVRMVIVRWIRSGICCLPESNSAYNSKSFLSSRQRFLNAIKGSQSSPSTASTSESKEKGPLTPTSKTAAWLQNLDGDQDQSEPVSMSEKGIEYRPSVDTNAKPKLAELVDDRASYQSSSDPRTSEVIDLDQDPVEKKRPVQRRKFPLGATVQERGSRHGNAVIVERF